MEDRIKEILGELDADVYWKNCNFPTEVNGELMFYSRDMCKNISFKELLKWYMPLLGEFQDQDDDKCIDCNKSCNECEYSALSSSVLNRHCELFFELIDYYSLYRIRSLMNNNK